MAHFILLTKLTSDGVKTIKNNPDRIAEVNSCTKQWPAAHNAERIKLWICRKDLLLALGGGAWFFGIANPVLYMIVLALITGFVLRWTRFGRYVYAIGGNEHAARLTGVPVRPIKVAVYMISFLSAGIAGIIQTGWLGAITTNIGTGLELQVIAAAVIGRSAVWRGGYRNRRAHRCCPY